MSLPPGPRLPRAMQAVAWTQRPLPYLERCQARYGDAFTLRIMHWGDWVILSDPADVKAVFTAGDAVGVDVANPLLGPVLGPRSVMLMEEPEHLQRRKLMLPSFHGHAVQADAEMMATVARREVERWPVGEPFELWPRMQEITQEVVMRAVFGPGENRRLDGLRERLRRLTAWLNSPRNLALLAAFGPGAMTRSRGYRQAMRPVEEAVIAEARRRRAEPETEPRDVVSMLVHARYEDGSPMSERDLRDELVTLLSDGPTSSTLAWAFERLLRNPEVLARTREEVLAGEGDAYLDAVIKETLRLRPPVPVVVRRLLAPLRLAGRELPAGTTVAPCIHLVHRDPATYPEPRRFRPERFLEAPPGTYTWIPFGGGVRRCLAASYAEMEMKRVIRTVLSSVRLEPAEWRNEAIKKSAISFAPARRGLVIAEPVASMSSVAPSEAAPPEADLLIVGAGAKAAAIAAKVHVVNQLGLGELTVTIVEKTEPAASWLGRNGMTSGEEPLAIPPIKDVGFPYRSYRQFGAAGDAIDAALLPFSWQRYAIERGEYAGWVNSGAPSVRHRDYGDYLSWVLERATEGVRMLHGRVEAVTIEDDPERWAIAVTERGHPDDPERHVGGALLLTGPGVHRALPHDPAAAPRLFHCDSRRSEFAGIAEGEEVEIAILGGGESALSALVFLRAFRPLARLTVFTPLLPMSRGESFLENRVFADPDDVSWERLDQQARRDFVKHADRGVFDAGVIASLSGDEHSSFEVGRALHAGLAADGQALSLEYEAPGGVVAAEFDYVVNCTGFDLLAQLRGLFSDEVRAVVEREAGQVWDTPPGTEVPIGRALELRGLSPRLHIPGLGGLSQGPGFANLGCLGLTANRVLQPLLPELAGDRLAVTAESQ